MVRKVLWTSGWDSTFRVLYSLIVDKVDVEPIYIIDNQRKSTLKELETMIKISSLFNEKYPDLSEKLKPITLINYELKKTKQYENNLKYLRELPIKFGNQYAWLSVPLNKHISTLENIEISFQAGSSQTEFLKPYLYKLTTQDNYLILDSAPDNIRSLFGKYYFPLINLTKTDMKKISEKLGFYDLMLKTWFCHKPLIGMPCGSCNPCKDARFKYNMKYRLNFISLYICPIFSFIRKPFIRLIYKKKHSLL